MKMILPSSTILLGSLAVSAVLCHGQESNLLANYTGTSENGTFLGALFDTLNGTVGDDFLAGLVGGTVNETSLNDAVEGFFENLDAVDNSTDPFAGLLAGLSGGENGSDILAGIDSMFGGTNESTNDDFLGGFLGAGANNANIDNLLSSIFAGGSDNDTSLDDLLGGLFGNFSGSDNGTGFLDVLLGGFLGGENGTDLLTSLTTLFDGLNNETTVDFLGGIFGDGAMNETLEKLLSIMFGEGSNETSSDDFLGGLFGNFSESDNGSGLLDALLGDLLGGENGTDILTTFASLFEGLNATNWVDKGNLSGLDGFSVTDLNGIVNAVIENFNVTDLNDFMNAVIENLTDIVDELIGNKAIPAFCPTGSCSVDGFCDCFSGNLFACNESVLREACTSNSFFECGPEGWEAFCTAECPEGVDGIFEMALCPLCNISSCCKEIGDADQCVFVGLSLIYSPVSFNETPRTSSEVSDQETSDERLTPADETVVFSKSSDLDVSGTTLISPTSIVGIVILVVAAL